MSEPVRHVEFFQPPERPTGGTVYQVFLPPPEFPTGGGTVYVNPSRVDAGPSADQSRGRS